MKQKSRKLLGMLALPAILFGSAAAFAALEEDDDEPQEVQVNRRFLMPEANFDQWVFQESGSAAAGRERINSHLKLKLDELNRVCDLREDQQRKLRLAARGDMKRFFDEVEDVRRKFLKVKNDPNGFNNVWQEIHPLQQQQAKGLFGDTSFFAKTIRRTLTDEQQAKYQIVLEERRRFRYRAAIEVSLHTLENTVALRHDQHEAVLKLVVEETQPPYVFGQYDHHAVMYGMSRLPTAKLKPLLDERQWKLLQQQFNQSRGMEAALIQNGIIEQPKTEILKSVRTLIGEAGLGAGERVEAVKQGDDTPADAQKPERPREDAASTDSGRPKWTVPEGWNETEGNQFSLAAFSVQEGEKSVKTTVSAAGGGLLANVNRWRGQLQLAAWSQEEFAKAAKTLSVDGVEAPFVELNGQESCTLGVIVPRGERSWFFKLTGDIGLAQREKVKFEEFVQSVKFSK